MKREKKYIRCSNVHRPSRMKSACFLTVIFMLLILFSGNLRASLYAEASSCNIFQGTVIDVVNDEEFTIALCRGTKTFKEFSYCYEVEAGDTVFFDGSPADCDVVSFTVLRNGVQCGVLCPLRKNQKRISGFLFEGNSLVDSPEPVQ